ncbi:unnamed protein product [Ambrosiozyma monospora]|uniref:Unnamed protein product n=1 Tax=Ambrosiozyma monospora TaxID=43982 RepID=A0A9W6Z4A2_AMBMO|nr:unnamed protein product [Ambrosiozyma monospora]
MLNNRFIFKRFLTTIPKKDIGFVFDIDGVLLKGSSGIPQATTTLNYLSKHQIPFILFTNGGGQKESTRANKVSKLLNLHKPINQNQIVQSHTPFKTLVNKHRRVLVVGGPLDSSRDVAIQYGFKEVLRPVDLIKANPHIWPFHRYTQEEVQTWGLDPKISKVNVESPNQGAANEPIDLILVFNDPRDMGSDFQIIQDLLNSQNGVLGTTRHIKGGSSKPSVPIVFSNNDFYWANEYPQSRFGQGVFRILVESIYSKINHGKQLETLVLGKPFKISYDYAHHLLIDWRQKLLNGKEDDKVLEPKLNDSPDVSPFKKVYMIGDNPESDILGANSYGWESILLRTGVYKDGDFEKNDALARPSVGVFDNVQEGVFEALSQNGLLKH